MRAPSNVLPLALVALGVACNVPGPDPQSSGPQTQTEVVIVPPADPAIAGPVGVDTGSAATDAVAGAGSTADALPTDAASDAQDLAQPAAALLGQAPWHAAPSADPPPIQGGTLIIADDGSAVAADPDHDSLHLVDLASHEVRTVYFDRGSEPGRVAADAGGRVHVVLRRTGMVATVELSSAQLLTTRPVCPAPSGIAYDPGADLLQVACESGELVALPAAGGDATRVLRLQPGLRDVIVDGDRLRVSELKSATLLELSAADGSVLGQSVPKTVSGTFEPAELQLTPGPTHTMVPAVAWRLRDLGGGNTLMVHQRAQTDAIGIANGDINGSADVQGNPYGNTLDCSGIVQTVISVLGSGGVQQTFPPIANMVLPVDAALGPGRTLALIAAGNTGFEDNATGLGFTSGLLVVNLDVLGGLGESDCFSSGVTTLPNATADVGQPVAVAFAQDGAIVVQSRAPNALSILELKGAPPVLEQRVRIPMGPSSEDLGHDFFHLSASAQVACASCHPGGADDGHAWSFANLGVRRSQSPNVGLDGTAPFHWDGSMPQVEDLVAEVFAHRMGGFQMSQSQVDTLRAWLFALRPPAAIRLADDAAAQRGRTLFVSDAGCADCHGGPHLTNNESRNVGTNGIFQVPSLVGVGYRLPVMHDGCARTLRDRFDPVCGGLTHGNVSGLSEAQLGDLVAYMETL